MMDAIIEMVRTNAGISQEQAHKAIEAVMAYVVHQYGNKGRFINEAVINSNGATCGEFDGGTILDKYRSEFDIFAKVVGN